MSSNDGKKYKPPGFHTLTANIVVADAERVVEFLKRALGFTESYRLTFSSGKIAHVELTLGDSVLNLGEAMEGWPARPLTAQLYVEDSDALFKHAVEAGATELMPMTDMFFGSREGRVADPFGNIWIIATMKDSVSPAEMQSRMAALGY